MSEMMDGLHDYDDLDDDDFEEEDDAWIDCALGPDGQCGKAGSEECDWECPYSHGEHYAGSELWCKAHDAGLPVEGCECSKCLAARCRRLTTPPQ